jgi:TonB family protein
VGGEVVRNELSLSAWQIVALIYSTGIFLLFIRLSIQLNSLITYLKKSIVRSSDKTYILEVSDDKPTFSFFNYIIIGQAHLLSEEEKQKIVAHERIHAARYHSMDILFVNMMSILFWFNPIIYLYKKALVQVHEFEADSRAVNNHDVDQYCGLLAKVALHSAEFPIANHFNNSLTLKRIAMLKNMKHAMASWKKVLLLPLVAMVILLIACDDQIMSDLQTVADQSTVVTNYPLEVQKAIDDIKAKNPKAEVQVIGIMNDDKTALERLDQSVKANEIRTLRIIQPIEKKKNDYDSYVVIEKGGTLDQMADITSENGEIFTVVEESAQPVGGMPSLHDLLGKNMQYPLVARQKNTEGKVFVQFIVNENGALSDFTVLKGIGDGCDEEAVRVLKLSPNWTPGRQRGIAVKQRMVLPITFGLSESNTVSRVEFKEVISSGKDFKVVVNYVEEGGTKKIKGSIVDENSKPLSGVNIVLEGGTLGTITKVDGSFEITPGVSAGRLAVSYVGYNIKYIPF